MSETQTRVNKKGFLEVAGKVTELLPNATFRVVLENDQEIMVTK